MSFNRRLFCLIKETDLPASHADADRQLEKLGDYQCGCGWPAVPCLGMHPNLRPIPTFQVSWPRVPSWQLPWNRTRRPVRL